MTRDEARRALADRDQVDTDIEAAARGIAVKALLALDRLAYAHIPGDPPEVRQVAYRGRLLGAIRTATAGPLGDWYAAGEGPFPHARAAAAALHRASGA